MDPSPPPPEPIDARPASRVSRACVRCRKQKLKCDAVRPCTLCHRARVRCEPRELPSAGSRKPASERKTRKPQVRGPGSATRTTKQPAQERLEPGQHHSPPDGLYRSPTSTQREREQEPQGHSYHQPSDDFSPARPQSAAGILPSPAAATTSQSSSAAERQQQRYGANSSAVGFAAHIFRDPETIHASDISSIPGHAGPPRYQVLNDANRPSWSLETMACPDPVIMEALIDAYFDRMHWFIFIFHEPSVRKSASNIFSRQAWRREELGTVLVCLTIAAVGLQCVLHDPSWGGHALLQGTSIEPQALLDSFVKEIRNHLWDLLDDCCIETVQVCSMIGTYYIFHASPTLSWSILGLAVRTAYALALHCEEDGEQDLDLVAAQVRRRNWNHIMVADTFAATIYGRPLSLDSEFSCVQPLYDLDDTALGPTLSSHPLLAPQHGERFSAVTQSTFHVLKCRLYEIIRKALNRFRVLRLQNPVSATDLISLVEAVQDIRGLFDTWRTESPPAFDCDPSRRGQVLKELRSITCRSPAEQKVRQHLCLQIQTLHLTYDNALLFVHRPLLEYRGSADLWRQLPDHVPRVIAASFDVSVHAAIRMSLVPMVTFEKHFVLSFMLMNIFTAGVILCIPPTIWPFSSAANEAKAGTLRIIRANRALKAVNRIALHTEQLLTRLLKLSLQQEVDSGLQQEMNESQVDLPSSNPLQDSTPSRMSRADVTAQGVRSSIYGPGPDTALQPEQGHQPIQPGGFEYSAARQTGANPTRNLFPARDDSEATGNMSFVGSSTNSAFVPGDGDALMNFEPSLLGYDGQLNQVDSQLDETFGTFGQMLFNLMPNDPTSAWTWGSTSGF